MSRGDFYAAVIVLCIILSSTMVCLTACVTQFSECGVLCFMSHGMPLCTNEVHLNGNVGNYVVQSGNIKRALWPAVCWHWFGSICNIFISASGGQINY